MIRISEGIWPSEVRFVQQVVVGADMASEQSFFTSQGHYKVDDEATPAMRNSLMYKMSYVRRATLATSLTRTVPLQRALSGSAGARSRPKSAAAADGPDARHARRGLHFDQLDRAHLRRQA